MNLQEFIERFAKYKHINEDEFAFFSVENYVLMYYINKEERNKLTSDIYQKMMSKQIANGIIDYLSN